MEDIQERIYDMVEQNLPTYSMDLNVLGFDVVFGNWDVGGPAPVAAYAIVLVARMAGAGGAVILGDKTPAQVNIHVIGQVVTGPDGSQQIAGDFWPTEKTVQEHIHQLCQTYRNRVAQQNAPSNGGAPATNPFTEALKKFREGQENQ